MSSHLDDSFEYPQHDYAKAEKLVKLYSIIKPLSVNLECRYLVDRSMDN